jgi:CHAT domain-containing protein
MHSVRISRHDLSELVGQHLREVDGRIPGVASGSRLYEILLGGMPIRAMADPAIAVVPDDVLHAVQFSALHDRDSSQFLAEHARVVVTPSASAFVHLSRTLRARASTRVTKALVMANSPDDHPLPELPFALAEAQQVASVYPSADVATQEQATVRVLRAAGEGADVIHVAAHAVANPEYPELSSLFLRKDGRTARLLAGDFDGLRLSASRVVVIASCSTGTGTVRKGEGSLSIARWFLAAGAPAVIAATDDIPDAEATPFFVDVHRRVAAGDDPPSALAFAQRRSINEYRRAGRSALPGMWARVAAFGGA